MNRKMYTFRCEEKLLQALKERACERNQSVSEVIHSLLNQALDLDDLSLDCRVSEVFQENLPLFVDEVMDQVLSADKAPFFSVDKTLN